MKRLIMAEKPSVAADIAAALGGFEKVSKSGGQWFERADFVISSAVGHLVGIDCPEGQDPGYDLTRLPALPQPFQLVALPGAERQLRLLDQLLGRSDVGGVINACDAGREGELIFRYIYYYCGKQKPMERAWLQSMTAPAIRAAFESLLPGSDKNGLYLAAQSRSEADWLVGINGSRAVTKLYEAKTGKRGGSSVGRVQTPTLCLVVDRERAIQEFVPVPYFEVHGYFGVAAGEFVAKWINTRFAADPARPEAKADRVFSSEDAARIVAHCQGQPVQSIADEVQPSQTLAPKLFDLTTLQREANTRFGLSAQTTLNLAQSLYEKHKMLTYPRTDADTLPEDYPDTVRQTLGALAGAAGSIGALLAQAASAAVGMVRPDKRIFNNTNIKDHFAIIPTGVMSSGLSEAEGRVFDLVVRRFVAAFFPPAKYANTVRSAVVAGQLFRATGRVLVSEGWLAVYGKTVEDDEEKASSLCKLTPGEQGALKAVKAVGLETKPPKRFTEATLLAAMEGAGASLDDEAQRELLKGRGLGTPATRAPTIEGLLADKDKKKRPKVPYMVRQGKLLVPTEKALSLIDFLRAASLGELASAKMTGEWEYRLHQIEVGEARRADFMTDIRGFTQDLVDVVKGQMPADALASGGGTPRAEPVALGVGCPNCGNGMVADERTFGCGCGLKLWREVARKRLSDDEGRVLMGHGEMPAAAGFRSKDGKQFSAGLRLERDAGGKATGKVTFVFAR